MTRYAVALTVVFGFSSLVQAQGDGPCAKDRETLCAGVEPGDGKVMKCMKENVEKLSPECKAHREKMKENMKDVHEACEADVEKLCGDVKPGRGRIMKCLRKNKEQVSEACKSEVAGMKKGHRKGH